MSHKLIEIIRAHHGSARSLLDVACGTGRNIEYLREYYNVEGLDINDELLETARGRCPGVVFHAGDMTNFALERKYDVITILFSSVSYVKTVENLNRTVACLRRHLNPGGLILIEPWFSPQSFWTGTITANYVNKPDVKIVWMYTSERRDRLALLDIRYMIGTPGGVDTFQELHELGLFEPSEYEHAFSDLGLAVKYSADGPCGRGIYVGCLT